MAQDRSPRQLPLDLGHAVALSRDNLVVSPANQAAAALVDRWPDWPSPAVVLAGPAGSGKSHLAAIWRQRSGAREIEAAMLDCAPRHGPLLVEGIAPGAFDEVALFHLLNEARAGRTHLLLTSRQPPSAWRVRLPDLASRLRAATLVEIAAPDDMLLAGVITKLFSDRQVEVEPHVVSYVIARIERSLATAAGVVARLDQAALEGQCRISRALAAQVIGALDAGQGELDL